MFKICSRNEPVTVGLKNAKNISKSQETQRFSGTKRGKILLFITMVKFCCITFITYPDPAGKKYKSIPIGLSL